MARISTYPISQPTVNDILIGSDADNLDVTKNYLLGDIIQLIPGGSLSVQSLNTLTGVVTLQPKGGLVITEVGSIIFLDASNVGQFDTLSTNGSSGPADLTAGVLNIPDYSSSGVTDVNSITGSVDVQPKGGIVITEVGNVLFVDGTNAGLFDSLTVNGSNGAATFTGGVLNVPQYQRAITVTTGGSGSASLIGAQLNIPYEPISLSVNGSNGPATLVGTALNIPQYQRAITVTTGGGGEASLIGAQLNIPYLNSYNTGAPTVVSASAAGSSSIPTAASSGATVNMYSCTWSGGNGNYTLTLPSAVTDAYRSIRVITDGTFTNNTLQVILTPVFGQTINGASSVALNKQYTGILVWSDGSNWRVIQEIS